MRSNRQWSDNFKQRFNRQVQRKMHAVEMTASGDTRNFRPTDEFHNVTSHSFATELANVKCQEIAKTCLNCLGKIKLSDSEHKTKKICDFFTIAVNFSLWHSKY